MNRTILFLVTATLLGSVSQPWMKRADAAGNRSGRSSKRSTASADIGSTLRLGSDRAKGKRRGWSKPSRWSRTSKRGRVSRVGRTARGNSVDLLLHPAERSGRPIPILPPANGLDFLQVRPVNRTALKALGSSKRISKRRTGGNGRS